MDAPHLCPHGEPSPGTRVPLGLLGNYVCTCCTGGTGGGRDKPVETKEDLDHIITVMEKRNRVTALILEIRDRIANSIRQTRIRCEYSFTRLRDDRWGQVLLRSLSAIIVLAAGLVSGWAMGNVVLWVCGEEPLYTWEILDYLWK